MLEHLKPKTESELHWLPDIYEYETYVASLPPLEYIQVRDGRRLTFRDVGPRDGVPIVSLHGNPGSSASLCPPPEILEEIGVRIIAPNRAGSLSDRHEGLYISDTTDDIEDLVDRLGIKRFGLVAGSGGVPHAVACAALLPERTIALMVLAGYAPTSPGIDWTTGMTPDNQAKHAAARSNSKALAKEFSEHAQAVQQDPFALIKSLLPDLKPADLQILAHKDTCCSIAAGHAEGLGQNGHGWLDDVLAMHKSWGRKSKIDFSAIKAPTTVWYGVIDPFSPVQHAEWLASQIIDTVIIGEDNASHFNRFAHYKGALMYTKYWARYLA